MCLDSNSDFAHADALYVRGLIAYYQGKQSDATSLFEQSITLNEEHKYAKEMMTKVQQITDYQEKGNFLFSFKRAQIAFALYYPSKFFNVFFNVPLFFKFDTRKNIGNESFTNQMYGYALHCYKKASEIDPLNKAITSKLIYNQALSNSKQRKYNDAILNCTKALEMNPIYFNALWLRANCYNIQCNYENAISDLTTALSIKDKAEIRTALANAKASLKRIAIEKDYYGILKIGTAANTNDIRIAYKKMALIYHSDKNCGKNQSEIEDKSTKFKQICEAARILMLCSSV